jgi:hypothetical protein
MRTFAQLVVSELECGNRLVPGDRRELVEELIEAVTVLQVIDEVSKRHASTDEHRDATENLGITVNHGLAHGSSQLALIRSA